MKNSICYIFAAGNYFEPPSMPSSEDYIIAVDGGYHHLERQGIRPDIMIGDFDSYPIPPKDIHSIQLPSEKDHTDMVAALEIGLEKGFCEFYICGGTGGRIDHTIANVQCLAYLASKNVRGFLFNQNSIITAVQNTHIQFGPEACGYISVFAHSEKAIGVNEKGLKYTLNDATLYNTCPSGISNEFIGKSSYISVDIGTLIIIYPKHIRGVFL